MKQHKISERKLKKAEEEITRIVNDLFKNVRGLEWIEPDITIFLHSTSPLSKRIYEKVDAFQQNETHSKVLFTKEPYYSSPLTIYIHR